MAVRVVNALSDRHQKQMQHLGDFLGLAAIRYEDLGNGENYIMEKADGTSLTLQVRGNRDQGGFLAIECGLKPLRGCG